MLQGWEGSGALKNTSFTRREFLRIAGVGSAAAVTYRLAGLADAAETGAGAKPSIVLIVADDLGYGELGCQGSKDIPTPHIDSIASSGIRFTSGYVSCPVCSPTRAGLMTGRYQQRFGHEFNPGPAAGDAFGLPKTETILPEYLKKAGYVTGMVGKWHLGVREDSRPVTRGFDEFFGFLGGAHQYNPGPSTANNSIMRGNRPIEEKEYLTDAFAREAVSFIDRHAKEAFFLYLPFNAVHSPLQAPEKYQKRFPDIPAGKRRTFAAMTAAMDDAVGAVLDALRKHGVEDNTLVFFVSDNGGPTASTTSRNDPLRGFKGQVWEGGVRVPFMVQWKGRLPKGKVYDMPLISLDIAPTILAAAGASAPADAKLDGVDLLPHLANEGAKGPHEALYWRFGEQHAIRKGDWKLVRVPNAEPALYNLAEDISESKDVAAANPGRLKELTAELEAWEKQLKAPAWKRSAPAARPARANRRPAARARTNPAN